MATTTVRQRALAAAGGLARYVPNNEAQLFAFTASPRVRADPWRIYQRLHRTGAVRATRFYGTWIVGSHAGVTQVLREPATSVVESRATGLPTFEKPSPFTTLMRRTLLFSDPPDHTRLRRLVVRAFTPRSVASLRPRVEALLEERLAKIQPAGSADMMEALAIPLPVAVICELLGVPEPDRGRFLGWARHLATRLDVSLFRNEEVERRGDEAALQLSALLTALIDDPDRRDPNGLIAALVAVEEDGDRLDREEVLALCVLLLVAGFETTANVIGNGLLALLNDRVQFDRLRRGDVAVDLAIEELLRFAGPVQLTQRVTLDDLDVGGKHIPANTLVVCLTGAANRDPKVFTNPDSLDLGRAPNPHLAFSSGIHHCLGAALARLETAIVIPTLLTALPDLELAAKPVWRETFVLRGLAKLPVRWTT